MERLTTKRKDGRWALRNDDGATQKEQINKIPRAISRLAAYEDTGLEPEEIREAYSKGFQSALDVIAYAEQEGTVLVDIPLLEEYIKLGTLEHLRELSQAEKDGRLVVMNEPRIPLVWGNDTHDTILCPNCNHDLMGGFQEDEYCGKDMYQCPYCGQPIDSGKAMTREEADAALKKREVRK